MSFCLETIKVDAKVLNDAYVNNKQHFDAFGLQRNAYYNLRDNIHNYINTCAENVKIVIYVDDVLEQPIIISAGKEENEVHITIRIDGTLAVKWIKETCPYETEIQEVNVRALDDVVQRFKHRFIGITPQRQTFYNIRNRIHDLVKTFADNVQISLYVDDVFDKPLIISAGRKENELDIIIKIDGTLEERWKKETCSYKTEIKEVNVEAVDNVVQMFMHRFLDFQDQRQGFFDARDKIHDLVKMCSDNVKIFIFVNDVLGKPIVICAGKMENVVHITVKTSGIVTHDWKKQLWKKCVYENGELMLVTLKSRVECLWGILELFGNIGNTVGRWKNNFSTLLKQESSSISSE